MALTHARFTSVPDVGPTKRYYQHIVRFSSSFAFAVDVAMLTLGGYLKKKENLSARLGDVLSSMYLASMVLKHYENQGRPEADLPIVEWACRNQLYKAQESLHGFLRNFPNRFIGAAMRALIFPRGLAYSAPTDRQGRALAEAVLYPTASRDRLCEYIYQTIEPTNPLGLLQEALLLAEKAEPIEKKIRVEGQKTGKVTALDVPGQITQALAAGIVSETEAAFLRDYDRKVMELIHVDDFAPHELGVQAQPVPGAEPHANAQVA
jgi:acyl-CoA dehydrogenase